MNYLIDFKDSLTLDEINAYVASNGMTILKQFAGFGNVFLISCNAEPEANDLIESVVLDNANGITLLGEITLVDSDVTKEFNINDNKNWWKVASIGTLDFDQEINTHIVRGQHSTVYVLDSGIDATHPEFINTNIQLLHTVTEDFVDRKGHGTMIASLISGEVCGLTGATIKVVKIFNDSGSTLQSELLAGFDAVVSDYIESGKRPSIVNCSWSIPFNAYINAKIQYLIDLGAFVVAAAGNNGLPIEDVTPASMPDVLTVGSFGQTLEPSNFSGYTEPSITKFTANEINYGALDCWAPGEFIWAAALGGEYGYATGTSCSAAIASGAIAYNFSRLLDSNGEGPNSFLNYKDRRDGITTNKWGVTPFSRLGLGKTGLLDISDPKYDNSENVLVVYETAKFDNVYPFKTLYVPAGSIKHIIIFDKLAISRIEYDGELPEWMKILESGIMEFNSPPHPDDGAPYGDTVTYEFTLHQRDGSIGTLILRLTVTKELLTAENVSTLLPEGDPMIDSILLATCGGAPCGGTCPAPLFCQSITKNYCFCGG